VLRLFAVFSVAFSSCRSPPDLSELRVRHHPPRPAEASGCGRSRGGPDPGRADPGRAVYPIPLAGANYQWARGWSGRATATCRRAGIMYSAVGMPGILLLGASPLLITALGGDASDTRLQFAVAVALDRGGLRHQHRQRAAGGQSEHRRRGHRDRRTVVLAVLLFGLFVGHAQAGRPRVRDPRPVRHPARPVAVLRHCAGLADRGVHAGRFEAAADMARDGGRPPHDPQGHPAVRDRLRRARDDHADRLHVAIPDTATIGSARCRWPRSARTGSAAG